MPKFSNTLYWRTGVVLVVLALAVVGIALFKGPSSDAYPGMPAELVAYWDWVRSLDQQPEGAIDDGFDLLDRHPEVAWMYLKLSDLCLEKGAADRCRAGFEGVRAADPRTELYRQVALASLSTSDDAEGMSRVWEQVAESPQIDPTLARVIVDRARAQHQEEWLAGVVAGWHDVVGADTAATGPAFGAGYAAVLESDWDTAEPLLRQVTRILPDDPQAYRELGRIYYTTGQPDKFEEALQNGIQAAGRTYDLEQGLILQGNLGLSLFTWQDDVEGGEELIESALKTARYLSDRQTEGFNLYRLANIRLRQHRYTDALALLDTADVRYANYAPRQHAEVMVQQGLTLSNMFRFSEAEAKLDEAQAEAKEQRNVGAEIQALLSLAQVRYQMGRYRSAQDAALSALDLSTRYRTMDWMILAREILGDLERIWGNFDRSRLHFDEALAMAKKAKNYPRVREMYDRLGLLAIEMRDVNAARSYFDKMLNEIPKNANNMALVQAHVGLGRTFFHYRNYQEAIRNFDLALSELSKDVNGRMRGQIFRDKAGALLDEGQFEDGIDLLHQAQKMTEGDRESQYAIERELGHAYLDQGSYPEALEHFDRAQSLESELQWSSLHWYVLYGQAVAYWQTGQLEKADQAFRDAISIIETLRQQLSSPEERAYFVQNKADVYDSYSAFLEEEGRYKESFFYSERGRSRSLVDLLYTNLQEEDVDWENALDKAVEFNRRLRAIEKEETRLEDIGDDGNADAYRGNRAAFLRRERLRADSLYQGVELDLYGKNQISTFSPVQTEAVQSILKDYEALLVYNLRKATVGREVALPSIVYVVLKDTVIVHDLSVNTQDLYESIKFFRDEISRSDTGPGSGWEPAARQLYERLVSPVLGDLPASIHHLNIVPEGVMHYLPFAALQAPDGHFLVQDYTLSIAPSATLLKLSRDRNPGRWRSMLLLADPEGKLPGARKEVLSIAQGATSRRHVLLGADVSKSAFEAVAGNYDIIHFATHGYFLSRAPWLSHLELYHDQLDVAEIGKLKFDAYLVTLSACETALSGGLVSDVPNGDEWVGLNQAFLAAGTPTVMASLWSIDDQVSSKFMKGFYDRLGPGGKAEALAEMQRLFIKDKQTRNPFYWAAFTVIGDPL